MAALALTTAMVVDGGQASAAVSQVSLTVGSDGTAPFDALDANANNGVVRTHDVVTYDWNYTTDAGGGPVTFTQTLAAPTPAGVTFDQSNLSQCTGPAGGTITNNGHTLTCQRAIGANASGTIPVTVTVDGTPANASTINTTLTATTGTKTVQGGTATTTIAAQPKLNLKKNIFAVSGGASSGGVSGVIINYAVALTEPVSLKGTELVTAPLSFTDDVSGISPHAKLVACSVYNATLGNYKLPNGKIGDVAGADANNSVIDSGSIGCTQPAAGAGIAVTVTGADLSGNTVPTLDANNATLDPANSYVGAYFFQIFVPTTDITAAGSTSLNTTNQLRAFDPVSISGQSNYGAGYESGSDPAEPACPFDGNNAARANDNCFSTTVSSAPRFGYDKYLLTDETSGTPAGGASAIGAGNGTVAPGSTWYARIIFANQGNTTFTGEAVCDKWDPSTQQIVAAGLVYRNAVNNVATEGTDYTVQYAALPTTSDDLRRSTPCGDDGGTWFDTIAAAGGPTVVNAIRYIPKWANVAEADFFNTEFTVPTGVKPGTIIGDWTGARGDAVTTWGGSNYVKETNSGAVGARLIAENATMRITKNTVPANQQSAPAGSTLTYTLNPTLTNNANAAAQQPEPNVTVTDTLSACTQYVTGSASVPVTVTAGNPGADGIPCTGDAGETGQTLTFSLGDRVANTAIPAITYQVATLGTTPSNTHVPNTAVISSDNATPIDLNLRTTKYDLVLTNSAQFTVAKTVNTPVVEVNDPYSYTLTYRNLTGNTVAKAQIIDELPYNGDGRSTAFTGTTAFTGFTAVSAGVVAECTTDAHGSINPDPNANTNTWSTVCPADTTAVRLTATNIGNNATGAATIGFTPTGNSGGNSYDNNIAGARASGTTLLIPATTPVEVDVIASSIGDFVWSDVNKNGLQDTGEPGIANFPVQLTGTDSTGRAVTRTTVTDGNGKYVFANLHSGTYTVTFDPAGLGTGDSFTTQHVGTDTTIDSDGNKTTGVTDPIILPANTQNATIDQGILLARSLGIDKVVDKARANPGDTLTYTVTVTNTGHQDAANIAANDTLPAGLTYKSTTAPSPTVAGQTITWTIPSIAVGASVTYTVVATINADQFSKTLINPFTITPSDGSTVSVKDPCTNDPASSCAVTVTPAKPTPPTTPTPTPTPTVTPGSPGLSMVKAGVLHDSNGDGLAQEGETVTYTFTVRNTGTVTLTGLAVTDPKLAAAGLTVDCPSTTLAAGAAMTCTAPDYTVTSADVDSGSVLNVATGTGCVKGGECVTVTSKVTIATRHNDGGSLAFTGVTTIRWSALALLLLLSGAALAIIGRRRRGHHQ